MSTSVAMIPSTATSLPARITARLSAYVELTKPKIASMVLVAVAASAFVATWGQPDPWTVIHAVLGTLFVAGSSCAANQWLERSLDRAMRRTHDRPLPTGRLSGIEAIMFSAITLTIGLAWLTFFTTAVTAAIALATWLLYVVVYTPLKTRTSWNTAVGAVPGALPVLIGWTAVGGQFDLRAAGLFFTLFLWQFPHFMAIAWLYRHDYANAGFRMLPTVDRSGRMAGIQAIACASALLPVSLIPALASQGWGSMAYAVAASLLGLGQLACAVAFAHSRNDRTARQLLRASLVYLTLLFACLVGFPGG